MVESKDLIRDLSRVPLAIARLMSIRQFQQTGAIWPEVFHYDITASHLRGGFTWADTPEGDDMWGQLLLHGRHYTFPLHFTNDIAIFPNPQLISDCYGRTE